MLLFGEEVCSILQPILPTGHPPTPSTPSRQEQRGAGRVPAVQGSSPCNVNLLLRIRQGCPWKSCRLRRLVCQAQDKLFSSTLPEQMPG